MTLTAAQMRLIADAKKQYGVIMPMRDVRGRDLPVQRCFTTGSRQGRTALFFWFNTTDCSTHTVHETLGKK